MKINILKQNTFDINTYGKPRITPLKLADDQRYRYSSTPLVSTASSYVQNLNSNKVYVMEFFPSSLSLGRWVHSHSLQSFSGYLPHALVIKQFYIFTTPSSLDITMTPKRDTSNTGGAKKNKNKHKSMTALKKVELSEML